jgi:uncharacterized protein
MNGYASNRVLKLNVGFLLAQGPGSSHQTEFDVPALRVSEDVDIAYLRGPLLLSRTKEGVLVQGQLKIGIETDCYRCLDPVAYETALDIEELFAHPDPEIAEFAVGEDNNIDLAPLLRAEMLILDTRNVACREACKGICAGCGVNLNTGTCDCEPETDPRFAQLKALLDASRGGSAPSR